MRIDELANWAILPGLRGEGPIPHHFHVGHPTPWSEGLVVRFENADGSHWVGNFQCGSWSPIEVVPWPESASILVNAGGLGYLINTYDPTDYCVVGAWGTLTAFDSNRTTMFVACGSDVQAYGRDRKLAWCSNGLAGLVVSLAVAEGSLVVEVEEEMGEPLVTLRLSAHDGSVIGRE
jgi:hypothetical protein